MRRILLLIVALAVLAWPSSVAAQPVNAPLSRNVSPAILVPALYVNGGGVARGAICFDSTTNDICLVRDGVGILAQRSGTTPQLNNIYNTFTSSTSHEKLEVGISTDSGANVFGVLTSKGSGGGTVRPLSLGTMGSAAMNFITNSANRMQLQADDYKLAGVGTAPALTTCGDGAAQTGSNSTSGRVVGTTQTACTLTFTVALTGYNSADCVIENLTANRGNVTAASASAFTVSNLTAGDDFMYICAFR